MKLPTRSQTPPSFGFPALRTQTPHFATKRNDPSGTACHGRTASGRNAEFERDRFLASLPAKAAAVFATVCR